MIPIIISQSNLSLKNIHIEKTETLIRTSLQGKINTLIAGSFENTAINWIEWNLRIILNGEVYLLRKIIDAFNKLIINNIHMISLTRNDYDSFSNVEELKEICRENNIGGYSKKKKDELISLICVSPIINNQMVDKIKFKILEKKANDILKEVFENFYETEWDKIIEYNRYDFVEKHNIKTCPYCNRGYIFIVDGKLRPEIDHFFPKSRYPYLAMSFYNLIPSCSQCNHTKKAKDTFEDNLLSPYEIDYNTFKFTYKLKDINFSQIQKRQFNTSLKSFDIELKNIDIVKSDEYFKLTKLYEQHKDIVLELFIKRMEYPKSYIKDLKRSYHFTDDEIYRFLLCNYKQDKDLHKRPLSKLIKDISEELGIL